MNIKKRILKTVIILFLIATTITCSKILLKKSLTLYDQKNQFEWNLYLNLSVLFFIISAFLIYFLIIYRQNMYDKLFNSYKVVGVIDAFDNSTNFVNIILKKHNKYYFQKSEHVLGKTIISFPLLNSKYIPKIIPLSDFNRTNIEFSPLILGDNKLYGLKIDEKKLFIGDIEELERFLETSNKKDDLLKSFTKCTIKN